MDRVRGGSDDDLSLEPQGRRRPRTTASRHWSRAQLRRRPCFPSRRAGTSSAQLPRTRRSADRGALRPAACQACAARATLNGLAPDSELLVSELVTNAVKATAGRDQAAVRLRLSGDSARVLIEVRDADPRPPAPKDPGEHGTPDPQEEGGRGLFLVAALSARWDWYPTREPAGKVAWCELEALSPARRGGGGGGGNHRSFG